MGRGAGQGLGRAQLAGSAENSGPLGTFQQGAAARNCLARDEDVVKSPVRSDSYTGIRGRMFGGVKNVLRGLQRWKVEGHHLRRYQAEIGGGHHVVDVCVHGSRQRDPVVQILRTPRRPLHQLSSTRHARTGERTGTVDLQRTVDRHRGTMRLGSPLTAVGLEVSIALPRMQGERV